MGDFLFTATLTGTDCAFTDPNDNAPDAGGIGTSFTFEATLSWDPGTSQAWLTLGGKEVACACAAPPTSWPAAFDGQTVTATFSAPRNFSECGSASVPLQETFAVALLSASQAAAVGGACPPNPLDGGIPGATDGGADGGLILMPGPTANGFDARLACGVLIDTVVPGPDAGASCPPCSWNYTLGGTLQ
jgi:hypothetical protein